MVFREATEKLEDRPTVLRYRVSDCSKETMTDVLRGTEGGRPSAKELWWYSDDVLGVIKTLSLYPAMAEDWVSRILKTILHINKFQLHKKWRQPVASVLKLGGVKIAKDGNMPTSRNYIFLQLLHFVIASFCYGISANPIFGLPLFAVVHEFVVEIVRDDPTKNVPDSIFSKLGMQLHRRDQHPLGILKNAIYDYFDTNYPNKFDKFDDLCPVVSTIANFDDVLVAADHVSRSYNDTYYVDSETVWRCHTSAHQAQLLRGGHTHFLVTGDVYRRDSIDSTHYPVFHQMEGVRVFTPANWKASGNDATSYAVEDLKKCLEGLARHLFAGVEMRWIDTYFPFTNPSFELEIYFQVLFWITTIHEELKEEGPMLRSYSSTATMFLIYLCVYIVEIYLCVYIVELFNSKNLMLQTSKPFMAFSKAKTTPVILFTRPLTTQYNYWSLLFPLKIYRSSSSDILYRNSNISMILQYPPCYKDMSFWISDSFTENNLCEVVRGIAGDLVEEVKLIDNFTNKKGMTSHCYRIAYRSMERSLTDEEINDLQWRVREQVETKLRVVLR
ncbi:phenylalanine--tRNA ligase, chloroplastic/mitochondrial-like [Olea europaea var. sylvestris]|uniref:phenylalanine--tRNA ligase, chloroplastic/mitochondrial-like n=1 Tax=Olea europaea var. sylvestris TaxID=158386 RepID=UPI000C1D6CB8|nr:phenylalanine--tRNA ligase, chloroplastic/mitochondrial-like [Olea europaea var. sylvestris]